VRQTRVAIGLKRLFAKSKWQTRDDTMLVKEQDDIDVESRNPLYTRRLAELWQK
jgi:hypothetical protein